MCVECQYKANYGHIILTVTFNLRFKNLHVQTKKLIHKETIKALTRGRTDHFAAGVTYLQFLIEI